MSGQREWPRRRRGVWRGRWPDGRDGFVNQLTGTIAIDAGGADVDAVQGMPVMAQPSGGNDPAGGGIVVRHAGGAGARARGRGSARHGGPPETAVASRACADRRCRHSWRCQHQHGCALRPSAPARRRPGRKSRSPSTGKIPSSHGGRFPLRARPSQRIASLAPGAN